MSLLAAGCSSSNADETADATATAAPPTTVETRDTAEPEEVATPTTSVPESTTAPTTTEPPPPPSPYVSLTPPAGFRRSSPGVDLAGVVAASAGRPRIAVGTETLLDGTWRPVTWTWEPGGAANASPLPGDGRPLTVATGASGTVYVIGYVPALDDTFQSVLWTSTDRATWSYVELSDSVDFGTPVVELADAVLMFARSDEGLDVRRVQDGQVATIATLGGTDQFGGEVDGAATNGTSIVVITGLGDFVSTDAGVTWQPISILPAAEGDVVNGYTVDVHWLGDRYVALGGLGPVDSRSTLQTWTSPDGVTWSPEVVAGLPGPIEFARDFTGSASSSASDGVRLAVYASDGQVGAPGTSGVALRDASGVWSWIPIAADAGLDALRRQVAVSPDEVLWAEWRARSSMESAAVSHLVDGALGPTTVLAADEGTISGASVFAQGGETNVVLDWERFDSITFQPAEAAPVRRTIAATSDRGTSWAVAEELAEARFFATGPTHASDGSTAIRVGAGSIVDVRAAGEATWQPTGTRAEDVAHVNGVFVIDSGFSPRASIDLANWVDLPTNPSVPCRLPDGRFLVTWDNGDNVPRLSLFGPALEPIGEVPPPPGYSPFSGCISTAAGVIVRVDGDYQITSDGVTFAPAVDPSFGFLRNATYGFGQVALGDQRGLSITADGQNWRNVPFPRPYEQLLAIGATPEGWLAVVDDGAGAQILLLPEPPK